MVASPIGWGLIGASNIARQRIAGAIQHSNHGRLVGIASHSPSLAQQFARDFNIPFSYASVADLLANPEVAAVYVSSTNQHHHAQVLAAAAAGKHVLCEKPLATRLEDAIEMVAACRARGLVMGTNHHLRNATTVRAIRQRIADGSIGETLSAMVSQPIFIPEKEWRRTNYAAGAGVSFDILVHSADAIRFVLGREPVEVSAIGRSSPSMAEGVHDAIMAVFGFEGGAIAQLYADFNTPQARNRIEIHGSEGSIVGADVLGKAPGLPGRVSLRRKGVEEEIAVESDTSRYLVGINLFNAAIRGEGQPACSGGDGIRSLAMILAAEQAARTGIRVPIGNEGLEFH